MKLQIANKEKMELFHNLLKLVDSTGISDVRLQMSKKEVNLYLSTDNNMYIDIFFKEGFFDNYECDKDCVAVFRISDLKRILDKTNFKTTKVINLQFGDKEVFDLTIKGNVNKKYEVRLFDDDVIIPQRISSYNIFKLEFKILCSDWIDMLNSMFLKKGDTRFNLNYDINKGLKLSDEGRIMKSTISSSKRIYHVLKEPEGSFLTGHNHVLMSTVVNGINSIFKDCIVKCGKDIPIGLFANGDNIDVVYISAPYVSTTGEGK